jgi:transaldolase / glucose-6-phosphate isomerase
MSTLTSSVSSGIENPLKQLARFGQSIWLDYIRRSLMTSGDLRRMVEEDGLGGMTSNPSIFEKAMGGAEYADSLVELQKNKTWDAKGIYEGLAIRDIQDAADVLRPVYDRTKRHDGYVSMEVSPYLAYKTQETIDEALRLWKAVNRPNLMIKIPGTPAGVPAIETVLREGVNVNVTLLFSQDMYEEVAWAFVRALEQRAAKGQDLAGIAGVASFFVSRIDTAVDALIDERLPQASPEQKKLLESVRSKVAIANAKLAYERYQRIFAGPRWEALVAKGAQTQRVLWASTSTKNPMLRDVLYIEELIGKDTVNTIPPATYEAFRDHGVPRASLTEDVEGARTVMANLEASGISIDTVTADLVTAGVKQFEDAFAKLLAVTHPQ